MVFSATFRCFVCKFESAKLKTFCFDSYPVSFSPVSEEDVVLCNKNRAKIIVAPAMKILDSFTQTNSVLEVIRPPYKFLL